MASAWVERVATGVTVRHKVRYRIGGRSTAKRYGGQFRTKREADLRVQFIERELAAMRIPEFDLTAAEPVKGPTLAEAAETYKAARVDLAENTRKAQRSSIFKFLGALPPGVYADAITVEQCIHMVSKLHADGDGDARDTIKKALQALRLVLDHAAIDPNPARDKRIKLPREDREEFVPPIADHIETVYDLLPEHHRLALLWLDWSGARVGSIDGLRVGDYDQPHRRIRVPAKLSKTRRPLLVDLHPVIADAIEARIGPLDGRDRESKLFPGCGSDALRTAISKACAKTGTPHFSPHGFRRRRVSLLHDQDWTWAEIGKFVGQRDLAVTANIYTFVLMDTRELDYANLLARAA